MTNLLSNPSFEADWITDQDTGNQIPDGWQLSWMPRGTTMLSRGAFPNDDAPVIETVQNAPECVHKHDWQLPIDEQLGGENALILDGENCYKVFGSQFSATLMQTVSGLQAGRRVVFSVPIQAHHENDGSYGAIASRIWIDGFPTEWATFSGGFPDPAGPEWVTFSIDSLIADDGMVTVGIDLEGRAVDRPSFFLDALTLEYVDEEPPPRPECPPADYVITVELPPQDATLAEKQQVLTATHDDKRTIAQSYDDVRFLVARGLPGSKVVLWGDSSRHPDNIEAWFNAGGVEIVEWREFDGEEPPDPPDPPDPPTGEPDPYPLRRGGQNLLGLHSGFPRAQTENYVRHGLPTAQKFFSAGDAWYASLWAADADFVSIWRKYVGNSGLTDPLRDHAQWYVDQYSLEIDAAASNMGLTVDQLLAGITGVESMNEEIPTGTLRQLQRAVEFDVYFAEYLKARYGDAVRPVLLCGAIGNPDVDEVHHMIPAAKAAADNGGFVGYHGYWTRNEATQCIADHWEWHAGRWMEWDKTFREAGVYPRYISGEGGIVYAHNCTGFESGLGWKSCGSFDLYLSDMHVYLNRVQAWNAVHANRCAGITLFGYGNWGWDDFELGDGEITWMANEFGDGIPAADAVFSTLSAEQSLEKAIEDQLSKGYVDGVQHAYLAARQQWPPKPRTKE